MTRLKHFCKHVQKPAVHWTKTLCKEIFVNGLIAEVEVPSVAIIGNAVALKPITQPLKLSTVSLILTLTLHLCGLLVHQEVLSQ